MAAVNGAVYVLRQPIDSLLLDPETKQCKGIQTGSGQVSLLTSQAGTFLLLRAVMYCQNTLKLL